MVTGLRLVEIIEIYFWLLFFVFFYVFFTMVIFLTFFDFGVPRGSKIGGFGVHFGVFVVIR